MYGGVGLECGGEIGVSVWGGTGCVWLLWARMGKDEVYIRTYMYMCVVYVLHVFRCRISLCCVECGLSVASAYGLLDES